MNVQAQVELGTRRAPFASPLALVGVAYTSGGVSPEVGFDCYTLLCYVRWHWYGRRTPFAGIPARRLTAAQACALGIARALGAREGVDPIWRVCAPADGCAVALGRSQVSRLHHCGVWFERGVLHAYRSLGVVWTPAERLLYEFARVEFYECGPAQNHI